MFESPIRSEVFYVALFIFFGLAPTVTLSISLIAGAIYRRLGLGFVFGFIFALVSSPTGFLLFVSGVLGRYPTDADILMLFVVTGFFFALPSWLLINFIHARAEASLRRSAQTETASPLAE